MAYNQSMQNAPNPVAQEYRGTTLYNTAGLANAEFSMASKWFKEMRDDSLATFYQELTWSWGWIAVVASAALVALWASLIATDWILSA